MSYQELRRLLQAALGIPALVAMLDHLEARVRELEQRGAVAVPAAPSADAAPEAVSARYGRRARGAD